MELEFHDDEEGNSHTGTHHNIDYDYQAEQSVQDMCSDWPYKRPFTKAILKDDGEERAFWEREGDEMKLVKKEPRFTGEWVLGLGYPCKDKEPT